MLRKLKSPKMVALLCLLAVSLAAQAATPQKQTMTANGAERIYYTLVPDNLTTPAPLLLLLHGSGRDGMSQMDEWKDLAEKEGLILVAPNSANSREWPIGIDGPEFLHDLIETVRSKNRVDGRRIYVFGHSAGAVFALTIGVLEPLYFAAAGVHAGAIKQEHYSYFDLAKRKIPLSIWIGTEDPYFSLALVKGTQSALNQHGFQAQVIEMKGHDHNYYAVSKELNPQIWDFFRNHKLDAGPSWQAVPQK